MTTVLPGQLRLPTLKHAMTPFPYSVDIDARVADARDVLAAQQFHHLPVTADGKVIGMVDDRALLLADTGDAVRDHLVSNTPVVAMELPLLDVLGLMQEHSVSAVVVTRHDHLAGVFTANDACRELGALLATLAPAPDGGLVA